MARGQIRYMLDTNICSYFIRGRDKALIARMDAEADRICTSVVTLGELVAGAELKPSWRETVEAFTDFIEILDFGRGAAQHYGQLRAELQKTGKPIGANDMLIAAHARSAGLIIVTNNSREFSRVPGLRVEDWTV